MPEISHAQPHLSLVLRSILWMKSSAPTHRGPDHWTAEVSQGNPAVIVQAMAFAAERSSGPFAVEGHLAVGRPPALKIGHGREIVSEPRK